MAGELRDLSLSLMKAKMLTDEEAAELRKKVRERSSAENDPNLHNDDSGPADGSAR